MADFCDVWYKHELKADGWLGSHWWIEASGPLGRVTMCCNDNHKGSGKQPEIDKAVASVCKRLIGEGWAMYATGSGHGQPYAKFTRE